MSQTFNYSFTFNGATDDITVTTADSLSQVAKQQAISGWRGASGYAITGISGAIGGQTISKMIGASGAYNMNVNTSIADDNVIYATGAKDEFGQSTYDGLSSAGIAFQTADGSLWNLYFLGDYGQSQVIGLTQYTPQGGNNFYYSNDTNPTFFGVNYSPPPPCYAEGARIATARGEIAVEDLVEGDVALTASGGRRPVVWIGRREVDCAAERDAREAWPIRIAADAFECGVPSRDLELSPGHNIAFQSALMRASALVNGVSVTQTPTRRVVYFHVELDAHDLLLAEGLAAESYLDQGNRDAFENGLAFLADNPEQAPKRWDETCLPIVTEGPALVAAKRQLLDRLAQRDVETTTDPDLHVLADGARIAPMDLRGGAYGFAIPLGRRDIRLVSRRFVPAEMLPESFDRRGLGVCVGALNIDGDEIDLSAPERFARGWWDYEAAAARGWRWTKGAGSLPPLSRLVIVTLTGEALYRKTAPPPRLALAV